MFDYNKLKDKNNKENNDFIDKVSAVNRAFDLNGQEARHLCLHMKETKFLNGDGSVLEPSLQQVSRCYDCTKCGYIYQVDTDFNAYQFIVDAGDICSRFDKLIEKYKLFSACKSNLSTIDIQNIIKIMEISNTLSNVYNKCEKLVTELAEEDYNLNRAMYPKSELYEVFGEFNKEFINDITNNK